MLIPGTEDREKILHRSKDIKSLITAQSEVSRKDAVADAIFTQLRSVIGDKECTKFRGGFSSSPGLQSLVAIR